MSSSPKDQRHYEPRSAEELEAEFAGWHVWNGVNERWYARRPKTSPPWVVGPCEDLFDLRLEIIGCIWRHSRRGSGLAPKVTPELTPSDADAAAAHPLTCRLPPT